MNLYQCQEFTKNYYIVVIENAGLWGYWRGISIVGDVTCHNMQFDGYRSV